MKVSGNIVKRTYKSNPTNKPLQDFEKIGYTPESLNKKIQEYFSNKPEEIVNVTIKGKPVSKKMKIYTLPGLVLHIGMHSIGQYKEWMKVGKSNLSNVLKKGYTMLQEYHESQLIKTNNSNPIFILKNMDYSDNQIVNSISSDGSMSPKPLVIASGDQKEAAKQITKLVKELAEKN